MSAGFQHFDTSVSALAHKLGVSWHTVWNLIKADATRRIAAARRLRGVNALGVNEHVVRHEALLFRMEVREMEVRDLHRLVIAAAG